MPINLEKGQKVSLSKECKGLQKVIVGLGWDTNAYSTGSDFDLDASCFCLSDNGKVYNEKDFVFYGNTSNGSGSVTHKGDNRTGDGAGDDEQIEVDLNKVPADTTKIAFVATIYKADERRQNFGQVSNAYIRVMDESTGNEICRYDLGEDFSIESAVVFGELYKNGDEWKFNAIGNGHIGGLSAFCNMYGIDL